MPFCLRYVWENFTGVRDEYRLLQFTALSLLIIGSFAVIFFYLENNINLKISDENLKLNNLSLNGAKYAEIIDKAENILKFRYDGYILAEDIKNMGSRLFADFSNKIDDNSINLNYEASPPEMNIKAKILSGKNSMIILNVDGSNLKLKAGDFFMDGRGRIININKDFVIVRFNGKDIELK